MYHEKYAKGFIDDLNLKFMENTVAALEKLVSIYNSVNSPTLVSLF